MAACGVVGQTKAVDHALLTLRRESHRQIQPQTTSTPGNRRAWAFCGGLGVAAILRAARMSYMIWVGIFVRFDERVPRHF
jgi:hypothetical protein